MRQLSVVSIIALSTLLAGAAPALAEPAKLVADTLWRAGPSTSYRSLGALDKGTTVDVLMCGKLSRFCLVTLGGSKGWVPLDMLADLSPSTTTVADTGPNHPLLPKTPNAAVPGGPGSTGDSAALADLAPPPTTLVITTPPPLTPVKTVKLP